MVINSVDPLGDAGLLSRVFDTSSLLPVIVVLATLGVFFFAWATASKIDSNVEREGVQKSYTHAESLLTHREGVPVSLTCGCCCMWCFLVAILPFQRR